MKMICNLEGKGVGCGGPLFFQDAIRSFQLEEKSQNQTYCVKWAKPFGRTWALNRWQLQVYGGYGGEKPFCIRAHVGNVRRHACTGAPIPELFHDSNHASASHSPALGVGWKWLPQSLKSLLSENLLEMGEEGRRRERGGHSLNRHQRDVAVNMECFWRDFHQSATRSPGRGHYLSQSQSRTHGGYSSCSGASW